MAIPRALALLTAAAPLLLAACSDESAASDSDTAVAVTASDENCELERTELPAGDVAFEVSNEGSAVTEVYVYGEEDGDYTHIVSEVENIGPGTSQTMRVSLGAGTYEVACKPGQTGDGIRTRISVSGEGRDSAAAGADEASYDREIELTTDGTTITGLSGGAEMGEVIEFKLTNTAEDPRTLEVKDPSGAIAGEVEVGSGETGEVVVELEAAGTWQLIIEGGVQDLVTDLVVS